jgi:spore protease
MKNIRTDLALESHEALLEGSPEKTSEIEGVQVQNSMLNDISVSRVTVLNEQGAQALGKPKGLYITIEIPQLKSDAAGCFEKGCAILAHEIKTLLELKPEDTVLVAGLGNRFITPDSLGPKTVENIMVTRHLVEYMPEHFKGQFRPVSAISPGVLGITGIETSQIIKGISARATPSAVIVIDALASRKLSRLATTFQLCDTGVSPGSGVGNHRSEINRETLGVPVIGIGVPTVVDAATLTCDVLDSVIQKTSGEEKDVMQENYDTVTKALSPYDQNLFVTPRDIDEIINTVSKMLGFSINMSLHDNLSIEDITSFLS